MVLPKGAELAAITSECSVTVVFVAEKVESARVEIAEIIAEALGVELETVAAVQSAGVESIAVIVESGDVELVAPVVIMKVCNDPDLVELSIDKNIQYFD